METRELIAVAVSAAAAVLIAACGSSSQPAQPASPAASTSERLQHWRSVVASMMCPALHSLEQKRMAVQFNDQADSLTAIHDRQAKLHCSG